MAFNVPLNSINTTVNGVTVAADRVLVSTADGNVTTLQSAPHALAASAASLIDVLATTTNATFYPIFVSATTGNLTANLDTTFTYNPNTDTLTAGRFVPSSATAPTNGLYLPATNQIGFTTNSSERVRIDSNGNVGIGTSSSITSSILYLFASNDTNALRIRQLGAGNAIVVEDTAGDVSPFVITGSGSVGVGTGVPSGKINIYGNVRISNTASQNGVFFSDGTFQISAGPSMGQSLALYQNLAMP